MSWIIVHENGDGIELSVGAVSLEGAFVWFLGRNKAHLFASREEAQRAVEYHEKYYPQPRVTWEIREVGEEKEAVHGLRDKISRRDSSANFWLNKIEAALGICGPANPAHTLEKVEQLIALEKAVHLNRQEATALAAWGGATREAYREAATLWGRRIDAIISDQEEEHVAAPKHKCRHCGSAACTFHRPICAEALYEYEQAQRHGMPPSGRHG